MESNEEHTNLKRSASSKVKQYLTELHEKGTETTVATSLDLAALLDLPVGPVSGFLSRLNNHGVAKVLRKNGLTYVYEIDTGAVQTLRTSAKAGPGSPPGRDGAKRKHKPVPEIEEGAHVKAPTMEDVTALLWRAIEIAEQVPAPLDLSTVPTSALIDELRSRTVK